MRCFGVRMGPTSMASVLIVEGRGQRGEGPAEAGTDWSAVSQTAGPLEPPGAAGGTDPPPEARPRLGLRPLPSRPTKEQTSLFEAPRFVGMHPAALGSRCQGWGGPGGAVHTKRREEGSGGNLHPIGRSCRQTCVEGTRTAGEAALLVGGTWEVGFSGRLQGWELGDQREFLAH